MWYSISVDGVKYFKTVKNGAYMITSKKGGNMLSIIICSHANLASGIHSSVEMILGKQESLYSLGFNEGDDFFEFSEKIKQRVMQEYEKGNDVCCLTDLPNATPFNCCILALSEFENDVKIISGVSLPMMLELVLQRENSEDTETLFSQTIEAARNGICLTSVKKFTAENAD